MASAAGADARIEVSWFPVAATAMNRMLSVRASLSVIVAVILVIGTAHLTAQESSLGKHGTVSYRPWTDETLTPDQRADLVIAQMTLDEKLRLVHGISAHLDAAPPSMRTAELDLIPGIPRLGIPDLDLADFGVGVMSAGASGGQYPLLQSVLGLVSTWSPDAAYLFGSAIGRELRRLGYRGLGGFGVGLAREVGNDCGLGGQDEGAILSGEIVGQILRGLQDHHVLGTMRFNCLDTDRLAQEAHREEGFLWDAELLALYVAMRDSEAAVIRCPNQRINGIWACESDYTLNQVLKNALHFNGWVMSERGAVHDTSKAAGAGLDQEISEKDFIDAKLEKAVEDRVVSLSRINDMAHRILRSMIAVGVVDNRAQLHVHTPVEGFEPSKLVAEESIVLLKNANHQLPIRKDVKSIAVIGLDADPGAAPRDKCLSHYVANAVRMTAPKTNVSYGTGMDRAATISLARSREVAIVFVPESVAKVENTLALATLARQDDLVAALTAANPNTIVVFEIGNTGTLLWNTDLGAVLGTFFGGPRGADAIAKVIFGEVNPSGRLPITLTKSLKSVPAPQTEELYPESTALRHDTVVAGAYSGGPPLASEIVGVGVAAIPFSCADCPGGLRGVVGDSLNRRLYADENEPVLSLGYGLSYTTYAYTRLQATATTEGITVRFSVQNIGKRSGREIAQVYAILPAEKGRPVKRLIGWKEVYLAPGQSKGVRLVIELSLLSTFDKADVAWHVVPGRYKLFLGNSSSVLPLRVTVDISGD